MTKRAIILIDGSNLYFKLKDLELHHLVDFNFLGLTKLLIRKRTLVNCEYYVGAVKSDGTKHTQKLQANQQKLLSHLRRQRVHYTLGYLLKSDGIVHEKGVDVNIAIDMLVAAYEDTADHIILVSSDTDLLPAIKKVKACGKTVEYIGFSHTPSLAMIANCSVSRLLTKEDLTPFTSKTKEPPKNRK